MKKTFAILLALAMVLGLMAGCGGSGDDAGYSKNSGDDAGYSKSSGAELEAGTYLAAHCEVDGEEFPCDEDWLEIGADGDGVLVFEGEENVIRWELDGSIEYVFELVDAYEAL